jgi:hypothetical protein
MAYQSIGPRSGPQLTVRLNTSEITDVHGNPFSGVSLTYHLEPYFPRFGIVEPAKLTDDWDGVLKVGFSTSVHRMNDVDMIECWSAVMVEGENELVIKPTGVTEIIGNASYPGDQDGIWGHKLTFRVDSFPHENGVPLIDGFTLRSEVDLSYADNGWPKMVRGFVSLPQGPEDSCGGPGNPISNDHDYWVPEPSHWIDWVPEPEVTTGPLFLYTNPPSGTYAWNNLQTVTFGWDAEIEGSSLVFSFLSNTAGVSVLQHQITNGDGGPFEVTVNLDGDTTAGSDFTLELSGLKGTNGYEAQLGIASWMIADSSPPFADFLDPSSIDLCTAGLNPAVTITFSEVVDAGALVKSSYVFSTMSGEDGNLNDLVEIVNQPVFVDVNGYDTGEVEGNKVRFLLSAIPSGNAESFAGNLMRIKCLPSISDLAGNPMVQSGASSVSIYVEACPVALQPPENLAIVAGDIINDGKRAATATWSPPSTGPTPNHYELHIESQFMDKPDEWTSPHISGQSFSVVWSSGTTYTVSARSVLGDEKSEIVSATVQVPVGYTQPVINDMYLMSVGANEVILEELRVGPLWQSGSPYARWFLQVEVDNFADAKSVHFYYRDNVLVGNTLLPNTNGVADWVYLGESTKDGTNFFESDSVGRAYAASQDLPGSFNNKWRGLETALVDQLGVDSSKFAAERPRYWWDQPPVFGARFLLAAVAEHKDGVSAGPLQYSEPLYWTADGPTRNLVDAKPIQCLYEPLRDHPEWGVNTEGVYPTLTYSTEFDHLMVSWTDPTATQSQGTPPPKYQLGLFVEDTPGVWVIMKHSMWASPQDGKTYGAVLADQPPEGSYIARVISMSTEGTSQTQMGVLDITDSPSMPSFLAGVGGRSNTVNISKEVAPTIDFQTTNVVPENGSVVGAELKPGTQIFIHYNYDPDVVVEDTYQVVINSEDMKAEDYKIETQPLLHIITFLQVPPSSQHIVTIKQMRVTSTAAEDAGGGAELSNPDAFTVIYIRGGE